MVGLGLHHDSAGAKEILKIFSKTWKPRSIDSAQSLQIRLRDRRQGHIKCKHHEKSETPSNMHSNSSGIPWQQQLSICTPPASEQQKSHGKGLVDNQRDSGSHLTWLITHFPSPNASQVQVFSDYLCKWFLPVLPAFLLGWGPSTVSSHQGLCDAPLLTRKPPLSFFCHSYSLWKLE